MGRYPWPQPQPRDQGHEGSRSLEMKRTPVFSKRGRPNSPNPNHHVQICCLALCLQSPVWNPMVFHLHWCWMRLDGTLSSLTSWQTVHVNMWCVSAHPWHKSHWWTQATLLLCLTVRNLPLLLCCAGWPLIWEIALFCKSKCFYHNSAGCCGEDVQ